MASQTLVEQLLCKMCLSNEPKLLNKTIELLRLLELRASNLLLNLHECGKIVLCIDLAAELLGIEFEQDIALKLSTLRKSHYAKQRRLCEKLLDLGKIPSIADICTKLNCNEVAGKAHELLEFYKKHNMRDADAEEDLQHPQYAAMAVFEACKLLKHKIVKTKLLPFSNLRPTQWLLLEQRWDKLLATRHYVSDVSNQLKQSSPSGDKSKAQQNHKEREAKAAADSEDYDSWKTRMLQMAQEQLKQQQQQ